MRIQPGDANALPGGAGGGTGGFEHGGGRSPSLFGAGELLKDLVIIALIVAIVAPLAQLLSRFRTGSEKQPNADTPTSD